MYQGLLIGATRTDLEIVILNEVSQRLTYVTACMWNLKKGTNELIYKTEVESQTQKTNLWLPGREVGKGINW